MYERHNNTQRCSHVVLKSQRIKKNTKHVLIQLRWFLLRIQRKSDYLRNGK